MPIVICRRQEFKLGLQKGRYIYMVFSILSIILHVTYMCMTFSVEGITKYGFL